MPNYKTVFFTLGILQIILGIFMLIPIIVQFLYNEIDSSFFGASIITIIFGTLFFLSNLDHEKKLNLQQAFLLTALSWLSIAIFGSLPFVFSNLDFSFTNAFFESMSGITTTGSTIISNLEDMEILFDGIDLSKVSVSMTINGPAIIVFAFYVAVAKKQGVDISQLRGTLQNDILKEYIAQKEWIFPPKESVRVITDMMSFCNSEMPKYNTISISGYHIREAGSTAAQELAFTLANGFTYVEHAMEAGLDVDDFAPRLSFFFNSHLDFFEEVAKYRAARRIWSAT